MSMKKTLQLVIILLLCTIGSTFAQQVNVGIKAGLNASEWKGEAVQSAQALLGFSNGMIQTQLKPGFHIGAYASVPLSSRFALESGLLYSQKGAQVQGNFSAERFNFLNLQTEVTTNMHYIDMPLLAKVFIAKGFHVYAGPQISYLVASKANTTAKVVGFSVLNRDFDIDNAFSKVDVALIGGLGYRFSNGININAGYDYGLRPIDARGNFDTFNRLVKFSVGYEF